MNLKCLLCSRNRFETRREPLSRVRSACSEATVRAEDEDQLSVSVHTYSARLRVQVVIYISSSYVLGPGRSTQVVSVVLVLVNLCGRLHCAVFVK